MSHYVSSKVALYNNGSQFLSIHMENQEEGLRMRRTQECHYIQYNCMKRVSARKYRNPLCRLGFLSLATHRLESDRLGLVYPAS